MRLRRSAALAALLLLTSLPLRAQTALPPDLDAQVGRAMRELGVPGLSLAVVQDGRTLVARGYGVRRLGDPAPVDEHTLFGIGSNTKAMTTALLAMLVDEGKLAWDDRVADRLPGFALADPAVTGQVTVRDLLIHRIGLGTGAGDLLFFPESRLGRGEALARLRYLPLQTGFRDRYAYNNLPYVAAGALIEAVTGRSWEANLRERLFAPLGMTDSRAGSDAFAAPGNRATPHRRIDGTLVPVAPAVFDAGGPAGSVNASASDLARWMTAELDSGRVGERRLWSPARTRERWSAHTPIPVGDPPPELPAWRANFLAYGLGVVLRDYRGEKLVYHAGEIPGYHSHVYLVPRRRIGVAVLTNSETPASHAVAMRVVDALLGAGGSDWTAGMVAVVRRGEEAADRADRRLRAARDSARRPTLAPAGYAGDYRDPWFGEATVRAERGALVIRFANSPALVGDLRPWAGDTFLVRWRDRTVPNALVTFELAESGRVSRVRMRAASASAHFRYDFQDLELRPRE